jgi:hypothetical protein
VHGAARVELIQSFCGQERASSGEALRSTHDDAVVRDDKASPRRLRGCLVEIRDADRRSFCLQY